MLFIFISYFFLNYFFNFVDSEFVKICCEQVVFVPGFCFISRLKSINPGLHWYRGLHHGPFTHQWARCFSVASTLHCCRPFNEALLVNPSTDVVNKGSSECHVGNFKTLKKTKKLYYLSGVAQNIGLIHPCYFKVCFEIKWAFKRYFNTYNSVFQIVLYVHHCTLLKCQKKKHYWISSKHSKFLSKVRVF